MLSLTTTKPSISNRTLTQAYINRGGAYESKGENNKAIADFKKVLELSNDPQIAAGKSKTNPTPLVPNSRCPNTLPLTTG